MRKRFLQKISLQYRPFLNTKTAKFGFSIIELLVVIVIIGIVTTIMVFAYSGIQARVYDSGVESDVDRMANLQINYKYSHGATGKIYYSETDGTDAELNFTAKTGNVIDVVVNSTDFCVRGYNIKGTKKTITDAYTKESKPGVCALIEPSAMAISDSIGTQFWNSVSAGAFHTCSITTTGKAYCWGYNPSGQLGDGTNNNSLTAVAVNDSTLLNGLDIKSIVSGDLTTCAIASNDQAYCWGMGTSGQLGNNAANNSNVPVAVYNLGVLSGKTIKKISTNYDHTCAIASNNRVYCWGDNTYGQLGDGTTTPSNKPVAVSTLGALNGKSIKELVVGASHTCVITTEDKTLCWGQNMWGQLGDGTGVQRSLPTYVDVTGVLLGKTLKSLSASYHTCGIASDDKVYCWGINMFGNLGDNSTSQRNSPVAVNTAGVLSGKTIKSVTVNQETTCVIASNNLPYCWGSGGYGQLGNGIASQSNVPVAVTSTVALAGKTVLTVANGMQSTCSLASDNKIYCWGRNQFGQFGNNTINNSLTPTVSLEPPN